MIYKRLFRVITALIAVLLAGVTGYMGIEGWDFFDALYMTIITIASVGYGETHPLSHEGRIFTILLILCGSATLIYGLSTLTAFIVEGELTDILRRRKMSKLIENLRGHFIVCGISATGRYVVEELKKTGQSFLVIDRDHEKIKELTEGGVLAIEGDATNDAILQSANIANAAGLLTTLHTDADNLFVVVTARGLNRSLRIIAKAINEESERKLRQVGADSVVMPNFIGGLRMASEMIRPSVVSFLDVMLRGQDATVRIENIQIGCNSGLVGMSLDESGLMSKEGVSLVALVEMSKKYCFNPPKNRIIQPGDIIIVMGIVEQIQQIRNIAEDA